MNRPARAAPVEEEVHPAIPPALAPYVRAIGVEKTVELLLAFGGTEIYLAENPRPDSQVAQLIGMDGVQKLGRELGFGDHFRLPLAKPFLARQLKRQGLSVVEIARKLHIADTTARRHLRPLRDEGQMKLF